MDQHICKNCGNEFTGAYCNACGQKIAHRLDVKHILHELVHVFTHADKGIFSFIPKILVKPGIIALDYVEGRRKTHFNPFQYLILVVGLLVFIISKTHYMETNVEEMNKMGGVSAKSLEAQRKLIGVFQQYFNFFLFLMIPLQALLSRLFYRSKPRNYAEHVVLMSCIQAQQNTISILALPIIYFLGNDFRMPMIAMLTIFTMFTMSLAYRQFFKVGWLQAILKAILITFLSFVTVVIVVLIITIIYMIIVKKISN